MVHIPLIAIPGHLFFKWFGGGFAFIAGYDPLLFSIGALGFFAIVGVWSWVE